MKDIKEIVNEAGLRYGQNHPDSGFANWANLKEIQAVAAEQGYTITTSELATADKNDVIEAGKGSCKGLYRDAGQVPPPYGDKKAYEYEPPGQNGEPRGGGAPSVGVPLPMPDIRQILL